ncbi:unnamed protein product [Rotaria sp. Silwood1]|nr:unnamed protein product [Rotaria sp. Silwood1]CAF1551141.1 unnamed protein product [Rotaria sp. Silwood1]CAF3695334.1 unnamed protein product [Rotaria sp. Silwood1]CAF4979665.1 unnamed protein product [Rotaria sp. Silwood1]
MVMSITSNYFLSSSIENRTQFIQINKINNERWILGMIIGSLPFLLIVICWIFMSIVGSHFVEYCQLRKKRHRNLKRTNLDQMCIEMIPV